MEKLYMHTKEFHNIKAPKVIVPILIDLVKPKSVLDVGCGLATWLKVFQDNYGVEDILGIDASYLDKKELLIDENKFEELDLQKIFDLDRGFDLVICLEVAEHLPENSADNLINSLCKHSDNVLFSAAIPGQGGQNHVNEQWPNYWREKFFKNGYKCYDIIRPRIWNNQEVDLWYRQNIYYFSKNTVEFKLDNPMVAIHPESWQNKLNKIDELNKIIEGFPNGKSGIELSFKALVGSLINRLRK